MADPVSITHDLHVSAAVERLWQLTTDVEGWPSLTPTMTAVTRLDRGPLATGSTARVRQPRMRPATWTVTALEPPRRFTWETESSGVRLVAEHRLEPEGAGARNTLTLAVSGRGSPVVGRVAGPALRAAIATENDGFRRAAEDLRRPRFVDEHRVRVGVPPERAWQSVRRLADRLVSGRGARVLTGLLGTVPESGFGLAEEVAGRRAGLAGRHRFSRYWLDLRVDPAGVDASEVSAVTYADFPGPHGLAYRAAVVGSRLHVLAARRMLASVERDL